MATETEPKAAKKSEVVLLRDIFHDGVLIPAGTVLDASEEWVARAVLPYDFAEPKAIADKRVALEAELAAVRAKAGKE